MSSENNLENITPGGYPPDFGLKTVHYNLGILANTANDSLMRKVANGEKDYMSLLKEEIAFKEIPTKNIFAKMIVKDYKDTIIDRINNKDLISTICDELNLLHLENDGYVIDRYSKYTRNRENPVSKEELNSFFESSNSFKSKNIYDHIKARAYRADEFFSHVKSFKEIIGKYRDLLK